MEIHITRHPYPHSLSSSSAISPSSLLPLLSSLSLRRPITTIRMGGGPRTFPGGVSKWQWKRMQANKAKQLLKARLSRERQIYEMRKRAELKAAIADLERPWELVERAAPQSSLFSASADEQLKVLADRFQKPGGFDLWSDDDGPQLFETPDGLPTARFFPKGVVHSVKPYGKIANGDESQVNGDIDNSLIEAGTRNSRARRNGIRRSKDVENSDGENPFNSRVDSDTNRESESVHGSKSGGDSRNWRGGRNGMNLKRQTRGAKLGNGSFVREIEESSLKNSEFTGSNASYNGKKDGDHRLGNYRRGGGTRIDGDRNTFRSRDENGTKMKDLEERQKGSNMNSRGRKWSSRGGNVGRFRHPHSEDVYDMSLQRDGTYGFNASNEKMLD